MTCVNPNNNLQVLFVCIVSWESEETQPFVQQSMFFMDSLGIYSYLFIVVTSIELWRKWTWMVSVEYYWILLNILWCIDLFVF